MHLEKNIELIKWHFDIKIIKKRILKRKREVKKTYIVAISFVI